MLAPIIDWTFHASLLDWSVRLLHISAVGQTLFVLIWMTLPWFKSWVGRALMVKSLALMALLDEALLFYYLPPVPHEALLGVLIFALVCLGIWSQVAAIGFEMWRGLRARRQEHP